MSQHQRQSHKNILTIISVIILSVPAAVMALEAKDVPERAPMDGVMASPAEIAEVQAWAAEAFAGARPELASDGLELRVVQQDYNTLHFGESCMETPIRIGSRGFEHGLGTHANSEIVVAVPEGARSFSAFVGIDNNYDTQGTKGSVQFAVVLGGKEVFRSKTIKGSDEAVAVDVLIASGAREIVLKVDTTEDGPTHDQSDWADACFVMADGSRKWLDDGRSQVILGKPAAPSRSSMPAWRRVNS